MEFWLGWVAVLLGLQFSQGDKLGREDEDFFSA